MRFYCALGIAMDRHTLVAGAPASGQVEKHGSVSDGWSATGGGSTPNLNLQLKSLKSGSIHSGSFIESRKKVSVAILQLLTQVPTHPDSSRYRQRSISTVMVPSSESLEGPISHCVTATVTNALIHAAKRGIGRENIKANAGGSQWGKSESRTRTADSVSAAASPFARSLRPATRRMTAA
jgi:hypothetical protein